MSATSTVPSEVPSLFQSSWPRLPLAEKNNTPFRLAKDCRLVLEVPAVSSLTITVPAAVPSLFQSSTPCMPSLAEKKRVLPTMVMLAVADAVNPGLMSSTMVVPDVVPSLVQSSRP